MKTIVRKLLFSAIAVILGTAIAYSQNTVKHVIDRGETLQSIAQRYGTTVEKIIELNPDAAQFVYVGMEFQIPASAAVQSKNGTNTDSQTLNSNNSSYNDNSRNVSNSSSSDFRRWDFAMSIGYGFIPTEDDPNVRGSSFTYDATIGANFNITKSFYVGARIGYGLSNVNMLIGGPGNYLGVTANNHLILIPIETGYKLHILPEKISLVPYAGIDMGFTVKSTIEQGIGTDTEKKDNEDADTFCARGRVGVRLGLWGFNIGGAYVFPFNKNVFGDNSGYPEVSIGFGF